MMRSRLARSLPLALGLALTLPLAMSASAAHHQQSQSSGAADLLVAYENTLMAHADASLGNDELAQSHLNLARMHLENANRQLGAGLAAPGTRTDRPRGGGGGPDETMSEERAEEPREDEEMRGGGGGPARGPLSGIETMLRATEEELDAESTNRLVAAFTNELARIGTMGGGGGPGAKPISLADRITSTEHLEMAFASTGKAAGSTAIQAWDEAKASIDDARRHLDMAKKAPGNEGLKPQLDRADKAIKDAEGPIKGKSAEALERTSRAIREMSMSFAALPHQTQPTR